MKNKNMFIVRDLITHLDIDKLRNINIIEDLIRAFGIVCWGPPVFGEDEKYKNHSVDMAGIYQTPIQLAKALVYLSQFDIKSYLEIGTFQGGCFIFISSYLKRFNPQLECWAIDPTNYLNDEVKAIIDTEEWLHFLPVTSDKVKGNKYDLVFIDGDHSAEWVKRDWDNVGGLAKICMFHDIQDASCPDVVEFWNKIKTIEGKTIIEILDHNTNIPLQGIGIILRQERY